VARSRWCPQGVVSLAISLTSSLRWRTQLQRLDDSGTRREAIGADRDFPLGVIDGGHRDSGTVLLGCAEPFAQGPAMTQMVNWSTALPADASGDRPSLDAVYR
jgi:hypothetical protein